MATAHEWQQQIQDWQASGLSQAAYCRQHGLNPNTFNGWRRRYRAAPASTPGLLPIQVAAAVPAPASALVLRLAAGHALELPAATGPGWVAELLRCLG
jgi:transposase-like protein